jgi:hypothetical protein
MMMSHTSWARDGNGGELVLRKGPDFHAAALDGTGVAGAPHGFSVHGLLLDVRLP